MAQSGSVDTQEEPFWEPGLTMVYSYDVTANKIGFLRARHVVKSDKLVFVPGCYYYLVLRSIDTTPTTSLRTKQVGLVLMFLTVATGAAKIERRRYSKAE